MKKYFLSCQEARENKLLLKVCWRYGQRVKEKERETKKEESWEGDR